MTKILTVVGARPQFVKAATVSRRLQAADMAGLQETIVHTGQHYDDAMSGSFFRDLGIPAPAVNLEVGSGSHGAQTGAIMASLEAALPDLAPDLILVYGDTNSTLAAALVAAKAGIPLAHVEAGLRSFRRAMPEEVNRVVTDRLSDWLFCPSQGAADQLRREGRDQGVHVCGDVMYDSFLYYRDHADAKTATARHGLAERGFVLVTLHRAENTDDPARLGFLFAALGRVARAMPVLLPLHPRTRHAVARLGIRPDPGIRMVDPLPYAETIGLVGAAAAVATDSGGLQKEAFFGASPCITLRDETEWVETIAAGWNRLMPKGDDAAVADSILQAAANRPAASPPPLFGQGDAAGEILSVLKRAR